MITYAELLARLPSNVRCLVMVDDNRNVHFDKDITLDELKELLSVELSNGGSRCIYDTKQSVR